MFAADSGEAVACSYLMHIIGIAARRLSRVDASYILLYTSMLLTYGCFAGSTLMQGEKSKEGQETKAPRVIEKTKTASEGM
jgi:hypothetical protein